MSETLKKKQKKLAIVGDDLAVGDSIVLKTPNLRQARGTKIRTKHLKKGNFDSELELTGNSVTVKFRK